MWAGGLRSLSARGIAGCCPLFKVGTACGNTKDGSRSGLWSRLRYLVHQLVSTVSFMRLVSRPIWLAPFALLLGKVRNLSRLTGSACFETRKALRKAAWVISSSV